MLEREYARETMVSGSMMKEHRRGLAALLAIVVSWSAAGCGETTSSTTQTAEDAAEQGSSATGGSGAPVGVGGEAAPSGSGGSSEAGAIGGSTETAGGGASDASGGSFTGGGASAVGAEGGSGGNPQVGSGGAVFGGTAGSVQSGGAGAGGNGGALATGGVGGAVVIETGGSAGLVATGGGGSGGTDVTGSGGTGDAGAAAMPGVGGSMVGVPGPSCAAMSGTECGSESESCCTSFVVPGGSFPMGRSTETCDNCTDGCPGVDRCGEDEQPEHNVAVSTFALDKFEVTVGRFKAFVLAGGGTQSSAPAAGAGAHPAIPNSGWDSAWNTSLSPDQQTLTASVQCDWDNATWIPIPDSDSCESCAMNCVTWYEAFAFCIWDGGRLPTEAEWEYAAAGGDQNRLYPWGNDVPTYSQVPAFFYGNAYSPAYPDGTARLPVGYHPDGYGRWGHADLAGLMQEYVLDWYASDGYATTSDGCTDCANLTPTTTRVGRNGSWYSSYENLRSAERETYLPDYRSTRLGFRCARGVP